MSSNSLSFPTTTALLPASIIKPGTLTLDVLSGLHQGVRAPIEGAACTIGSSPACDLVLADRDIAAEHLQLRFYGRQVALDAIGGAVFIDGRPALQRGFGCRAKLPITVTVGGAKLRIDRDRTSSLLVPRWGAYAAIVAIGLVMVPIVAVQAGISALLPQKSPAMNDGVMVGSIAPAAAVQSDAEVVADLRAKLDEANLSQLSLSTDSRHFEVSGQIAPDRLDDWREIQRWFDRSHGGRYVLTSLVSTAAVTAAPRFVFQAVFFGPNPYVVDARGERRYPGAALQDGWMLKAIENGQILVVRGGQEFKLTL
ncbi:hypothetical protein GCM10011491_37300 [Brucella endophytica]|uniref:FHA domain-containing protein n=1 Tax=Brucella endophytica TaxID=1963359 RepID=A0A916SN81_9HYPH|nr:FHA domain-containing protein [Brucella endophytica]GGB05748.1 hypothetical protein GCM10011491_37300 [Brucella endophytica]